MKTSEVLDVRGHIGGEVSIHCFAGLTKDNGTEHNNVYFCKGICSNKSILIEMEGAGFNATLQQKYNIKVNKECGDFNVTIKKLKKTDAGKYYCGVKKPFCVLQQEVNVLIQDGK